MFTSARVKLTIWYLIIVVIITSFFSLVIYSAVFAELKRGFDRAQLRMRTEELGFPLPQSKNIPEHSEEPPEFMFGQDFEEAIERVKLRLFIINGIIWSVSAAFSYFFAGYTLKPIKIAMDKQKEFIANASHELRTPLTAMKTSLEVALRDTTLSQDAKEILAGNLSDVKSLEDLSNNLLSLSRVQVHSKIIDRGKIRIGDILQSIKGQFEPIAKQKKITLDIETTSGVFIKADAKLLHQLLAILVDNALKYTNKGQVKVKITLLKKYSRIMVSDTGQGIPERDIPYIFDRFYQAETSRSSKNGYGLGLAIAQEIVELHGGKIKVQSQESKGTVFSVYLPK